MITGQPKRPEVTRVVDPDTGGEKGSKLARFDLLPWDALYALAEHFGSGAKVYEDRNWERGFVWGLSRAALGRHFAAWSQGQDYDEDGRAHIVAVLWHAAALTAFWLRGAGTDDRPRTPFRTPADLVEAPERSEQVRAAEDGPGDGSERDAGLPDPWAFHGYRTPSAEQG